jgi:hypothetical protein
MSFKKIICCMAVLFIMPYMAWSTSLTVTVNDANGAVNGAQVAAICFVQNGPPSAADSKVGTTNASGQVLLN